MSLETLVIPEIYLADHLFLLVGTNPLPNFVAAKLLLKPGGALYLVHSSGTEQIAERLSRYWIDVEKSAQPKFIRVAEADGADIHRKIDSDLQQISSGVVGLNYTGGTKIMSVHACRTMLDYQGKKQSGVVLSYLDARTNKVHIEYGNNPPFGSDSVIFDVAPTLEQIIKLHVVELSSAIERDAMLPDLAARFAQAHEAPETAKAWRAWCENVLRSEKTRTNSGKWKEDNQLRNVELTLPVDPLLQPLTTAIREAFRISHEPFSLWAASQAGGFKKAKYLCKWLDGTWFEYHVLNMLKLIHEGDFKDRCRLGDIGMGLKPRNESDRSEYETDIVVMQGYRLYLISVTTDDAAGMCKLKLFEAERRAQDMGGDAAYVGLICLNDAPDKLQKQIGRAWDDENRVRVFGRPDLPNLADRIAKWFISAGS